MRCELSPEEWAWLSQYDGLDLHAPAPPAHVRAKLESLGLIARKAAGLGATAKGLKLLRARSQSRASTG
ncbi:MAG: hypothetical protein JWO70_929 [Betaproteobacteria bacterium]|jgi:hypothetical protein|nr:hypothetical protein [Betaproteobacteria bacterium]